MYVSQAVCTVGEGVHAIIPEPQLVTRFSAIGKYAFFTLSETTVDFGEVLTGTPAESIPRDVLLRNNSVVPAEFKLIRHDNDRDEAFDVTPKEGVIPANGVLTVNVRYFSLAPGSFSLDRYTYKTPGGCTTTLLCRGFSLSPTVTLRKENVPILPSSAAGMHVFSSFCHHYAFYCHFSALYYHRHAAFHPHPHHYAHHYAHHNLKKNIFCECKQAPRRLH